MGHDEPSADPEDIRDVLLATVAIRAESLHQQAKEHPDGVIGFTKGEHPQPILFPAWELQALLRAVTEVSEGEISQLRQLAKMTPAELQAAVAARAQIRAGTGDAGAQGPRARARASGAES